MTNEFRALAVHLLTATGAVFAMLAMLAAVDGKWDLMFLWLVVAFAVDGIDGPLARRYHVKHYAPQFDGYLLDIILDADSQIITQFDVLPANGEEAANAIALLERMPDPGALFLTARRAQ